MQLTDAPKAPDSLKAPTIVGLLFFIFGVCGFVLWAMLTPLDSAVVAQGVVKVGSEKKQVQHLEGGMVKSLLVTEGDVVKQGQVLITLDETFAGADHSILSTQRQELKVREAMLIAQRDDLPSILFSEEPEPENNQIKQQNWQEEQAWLEAQKKSAQQLFNLSRSALQSQISTLDSQSTQLSKKILGYKQEISAKNDQIAYMQEEIDAWAGLIQRQYANKLRFLELKKELSEVKGELVQVETSLASSHSQLDELQFERDRVAQIFREAAANELVEVQLSIKDLSKRIQSASNVLGRIDIKAPVDGKIVGLNVYTIGAVIQPGDTILEIVPSKDELVIGAQIRPVDIDKVSQFMKARIRLSSYKQHEFPEFDGIVDSVSADVFEDPKTQNSYYTARIIIPGSTLSALPKDKINPGMPADVMIVTGESTPAQYLLEPLLNAFRTAWRDS